MKLAKIAIFLAGVIGMTTGGLVTISALKANQDQELIRIHETLKSQATVLVDQFFSILESAKKLNPKTSAELLPYVAHYGTVKLKSGVPDEFESFSINDPALQERVMNSLKSQISMGDLALVKFGVGTYEMNETGGRSGILIAQPVFKPVVSGAIDPETVEKVNLILVDPVKALPGLEKLASGNLGAFLVHRDGKVLAHTLTAYVGADLKRLSGLRDSLGNLFVGAQTGFVQRYAQSDGTREVLAMVRAGVLPFAIGVEQRAPAPILSTEWITEQMETGSTRRAVGVAFVFIAIAMALFSLVSAWASRSIRSEFKESVTTVPEEQDSALDFGATAVATATDRFSGAHATLADEREKLGSRADSISQEWNPKSDPVSALVSRISSALTLEAVEREFVSVASSLSRGSVVYFRYQRRMQNLSLQMASSEAKLENVHVLQAYVRKDIELQVEQLSDSGKVASLTHYGPIKKIILSNFQGASYEAWAVTSSPEISLQSKLVGVLVLLNPDPKDSSFRPVLAKVMREAGNYLYAHGNKIKSRNQGDAGVGPASSGNASGPVFTT